MTFTRTDKLKALAIVHVFETSRPMGDYAALAVLGDGAGISYGISQFTHRSGALLAVAKRYLAGRGTVGSDVIGSRLPALGDRSAASIRKLAADGEFKSALIAAAATIEMRAAQVDTSNDLYLQPAIDICRRLGFVRPLSLAVIYDSVVHGSFNRVARTVSTRTNNEQAWIEAYVTRRDQWLLGYTRLAKTRYRTRFFLEQISKGNWQLALPLNVDGVRLTSAAEETPADASAKAAEPAAAKNAVIDDARRIAEKAAGQFDRVEGAVTAMTTRADAAKSMWTAVGGTLWQAAWAVFGFFAGLPTAFLVTAAVIAAILMLAYLYRQISLGRLRELASMKEKTT
jgi:chitosanase